MHELVEGSQLRKGAGGPADRFGQNLAQDIAFGQNLAGGEIGQPVVGQIGAHERNLPRSEVDGAITRHHLPVGAEDEVELDLRVVVPAGQWRRVSVAQPPDGRAGIGEHDLALAGPGIAPTGGRRQRDRAAWTSRRGHG